MTDNTIKVLLPGGAKLAFNRFRGTEQLSELYSYEVDLLGETKFETPQSLLGNNAAVLFPLLDGKFRYFNGLITQLQHLGKKGRFFHHRMTLRPWLWVLGKTSDMKIFQNVTAPDVIKAVFGNHACAAFEDKLTGVYTPREFCVQYRETDLDFVCRLMEEEGIYFYFKHTETQHTLVLCDGITAHMPFVGYESVNFLINKHRNLKADEYIDKVEYAGRIQSGKATLTDYNFEKPKQDLTSFKIRPPKHTLGDYEIYDWPGEYKVAAEGNPIAQAMVDSYQAAAQTYYFSTTARGLSTGYTFALADGPDWILDKDFLVTGAIYEFERPTVDGLKYGEERFSRKLTAIPSNFTYKPPVQRSKPRVYGPETAIITGPPGAEHNIDQYGRVKVQFYWDRIGKYDANSSCWLRVSTPWAGKGFGYISHPRIGEEVIVSFLHGDPDRPIVTGRVYNADEMPPYPLPANATVSTIKSQSSPGGTTTTANELRFEDKMASEYVWFQAQKDYNRWVKNDAFDKVDHDEHMTVMNDQFNQIMRDKHETIVRDKKVSITGDTHETVFGDKLIQGMQQFHTRTVGDIKTQTTCNYSLQTGISIAEKATVNFATEAGVDMHHKSGLNMTLEAGALMTLKVGSSYITLTPAAIFIYGPMVFINSGGSAGSGMGCYPIAPDMAITPIIPKPPIDPLTPNPAVTTVRTPLTDTWKGAKPTGPVKGSFLANSRLTDSGSIPIVDPPAQNAAGPTTNNQADLNPGSTQPSATALRSAQQDGKPFIDPTGVM